MPFSGFQDFRPEFGGTLQRFLAASPGITVGSGYRDVARQTQLWNAALQKYGSLEKARHWVAPPGHSMHNKRLAADLQFPNDAARAWAHANAAKYGLGFRMGHEPWHIELAGGAGAGDTGTAGLDVDLTNSQSLLGDTLANATDPGRSYDLSSLASNASQRLTGGDTGGQPQITETRGDTAAPILATAPASLDPETLATPWKAGRKALAAPPALADLFDVKAIGQAGTPPLPGRRF